MKTIGSQTGRDRQNTQNPEKKSRYTKPGQKRPRQPGSGQKGKTSGEAMNAREGREGGSLRIEAMAYDRQVEIRQMQEIMHPPPRRLGHIRVPDRPPSNLDE
jgi:hypothetical protein